MDDGLTAEVDGAPSGRRIGAFFDVDHTLLAVFSAFAFLPHLIARRKAGAIDLMRMARAAARQEAGIGNFSGLIAAFARTLRGVPEAEFRAVGERIFRTFLASQIFPESRRLVDAHRRRGHVVAAVSSALPYQVEPLARALGFDAVLCTQLERKDGRFTGEVVRPACHGEGKAIAMRAFAKGRGIDLRKSWFYGDSHDDLPAFRAVGRPRPLNPGLRLRREAARRGWPTRTFRSRGLPRATDVVRTWLVGASSLPSLLLGVPTALAQRDLRKGFNVAMSTWGDVGLALSGIELQVTGRPHLWSHRPAVFVFNHQSAVEMLLLCKLLRRDFVGIGKKEIRGYPVVGAVFAAAGTVFVERFDPGKGKADLAPAMAALKEGSSIAIAPEGTRSVTGTLGPFKKGAFHLAMQAKVPIVPIVFKNSMDALPKHGVVIRPTTVEVVVHPPIETAGWTPANLDARVAGIERLFRETLR